MFREALVGFITAALSIVVALAWRDYITFIFDEYIKKGINIENRAMAGLVYALVVTVIGLVVTSVITKYQRQIEEKQEQEMERIRQQTEENRSRVERIKAVSDQQITDDEPIAFDRKPHPMDTVDSILGVKDDKVLRAAIDDGRVDSANEERMKRYKRRLRQVIVPKDIGVMRNRYK